MYLCIFDTSISFMQVMMVESLGEIGCSWYQGTTDIPPEGTSVESQSLLVCNHDSQDPK